MVSNIENLAKKFEEQGFPETAQALRAVAARHVDKLLKDLEEEGIYQHPGFTFYPERSSVVIEGKEITLSPTKRKLLACLVRNVNKFVPTKVLIDFVWPENYSTKRNNDLKLYIGYLRSMIEPGRKRGQSQHIVSRRGFGYGLFEPK